MNKPVYQLDAEGFFTGTTFADESPQDPGFFLIPGGCVEVQPPAPLEGNLRRFVEGVWKYELIPAPDLPEVPVNEDGVPKSISRLQAFKQLYITGLLDTVETFMDSDEVLPLDQIAWKTASEFRRDSPTILGLASKLHLSSEQLDQLFVAASILTA